MKVIIQFLIQHNPSPSSGFFDRNKAIKFQNCRYFQHGLKPRCEGLKHVSTIIITALTKFNLFYIPFPLPGFILEGARPKIKLLSSEAHGKLLGKPSIKQYYTV